MTGKPPVGGQRPSLKPKAEAEAEAEIKRAQKEAKGSIKYSSVSVTSSSAANVGKAILRGVDSIVPPRPPPPTPRPPRKPK